jgi:hypothetical protein
MVKLGDLEGFNQTYQNLEGVNENIDIVLVALYIITHTYFLYGTSSMVFAILIYVVANIYFEFIFVSIVFCSYFASELLINQRVLRSSDVTTRNYATIGLTVVFSVFMITLITGVIEPYQGAIAFIAFYILQARYRTSTLTIAKISELTEKKKNVVSSPGTPQ